MSDREMTQAYKNELAIQCEICLGNIGFKQKCVTSTEGGYSHIKCAVSTITHACPKCGFMSDDEDFGEDEVCCEECGEIMQPISKKEARKKLSITTPAEDDPDRYDIEE